MAGRRLSVEEQAIWQQLTLSVKPLPGSRRQRPATDLPDETVATSARPKPGGVSVSVQLATPLPPPAAIRRPSDYLDNGWEKRIASGALVPDITIDLHGHTLEAAHRRLAAALANAVARRERIMLVVTGKSRPSPSNGGERIRGAIRAEIGHWLASSPHADAIASVRAAHPRHGGAGALYIILRRR